jgi:glycosyltransferase involved in cell wall biosynthesis
VKLLIISHTPHYLRNGEIVGWGPTVRELQHISVLADDVVHLAPLHHTPAPASALPYEATNIRVRLVPAAGGPSIGHKLQILRVTGSYVRAISQELSHADIVHIRCPANISLVALLVVSMTRRDHRRWVKYAGAWGADIADPWSYRVQRWWLRRKDFDGVVTVNGCWPDQPRHVHSLSNPCLTDDELGVSRSYAGNKSLTRPVRLLYVGALSKAKGVSLLIEILTRLRTCGVEATMDVVGDGDERPRIEADVLTRGLGSHMTFHGWLPRPSLAQVYGPAHFLVLPSQTEGWPKVVGEAMAYGAVPIASSVGSVPYYLNAYATGVALATNNADAFASAIVDYVNHPERWNRESANGTCAASTFTYSSYLQSIRDILPS